VWEDEDGQQESCLGGNDVKENIVSNQRQDKELMCAAEKWAVSFGGFWFFFFFLLIVVIVVVATTVVVVVFLRQDGACLCWLADRI
jgi:hypothetical protein